MPVHDQSAALPIAVADRRLVRDEPGARPDHGLHAVAVTVGVEDDAAFLVVERDVAAVDQCELRVVGVEHLRHVLQERPNVERVGERGS